MEELLQLYLIVCPLIFLGGFVDSVAGGGGLITLPAYLMAGLPTHMAMGTNKVVNAIGTGTAALRYLKSGRVQLRVALVAAVTALVGSVIGTRVALLIPEDILKILMLVALPVVAVVLAVKRISGRSPPARSDPTAAAMRPQPPGSSASSSAATTAWWGPVPAPL